MRGHRGNPRGIQVIDLLFVLYFMGFFVLGFAQGTVRRLLGIGSMLFSFILAAQRRRAARRLPRRELDAVPPEYSYMIAFGTVFVASIDRASRSSPRASTSPSPVPEGALRSTRSSAASSGSSRRRSSSARSSSSSTRTSSSRASRTIADELPFLRDFFDALDPSQIARALPRDADPGLLRPVRASSSRTSIAGVPGRRLTRHRPRVCWRLARRSRRPGPSSARGSSATMPRGRRVGRIVEVEAYIGPRRSRVARPVRPDRAQRGHVRARRASPTCTLSTGCTTASTW